ncbi:hypothetical protein Y11_33441 [Yersinia enterocolitica subsp. palearctica Y11]|uniref:Uncharacterized protein n=1 Tax=Yersinia enterocolitica subsp. palearctica serotype O:3 (strain DSM 13030 / CIP 106945 / Y11) TaxID=930944 RepID=A0A0H3NZ78_YERE1|nr:hypothetical protein Y11_33441 [Yersinia enterocolitica subsp. palearctica Y11]CCO70833.1 hypothetical protein D322_3987 [Yersinia enterocolitica IP 10393]
MGGGMGTVLWHYLFTPGYSVLQVANEPPADSVCQFLFIID